MKKCELCKSVAKMYCDSDKASLCWECDIKVHSANFLVAKHSRTLLCHVCQSLTPWCGSGLKLRPTVSVCENCVNGSNKEATDEENEEEDDDDDRDDGENNNEEADGTDDDDEEEEEDDDDDGDEDDEENQVVPWSPPSVSSTSGSFRSNEDECFSEKCTLQFSKLYNSRTRRASACHLNWNTRTGREPR